MCPMRAIIRLRLAYGDSKVPTGPFFLKVNGYGAITDDPIVSQFNFLSVHFTYIF